MLESARRERRGKSQPNVYVESAIGGQQQESAPAQREVVAKAHLIYHAKLAPAPSRTNAVVHPTLLAHAAPVYPSSYAV